MVDISRFVLGPPEQDPNLTPVHEDEALALMGDIGAKPSPNDAVPRWQVHLIELRLDDLRNVVEHAALGKGKRHAINRMLLHVLVHIRVFHHGILRVLLIDIPVRLNYLCVGFPLPLLRLLCSSVSCNLCDGLSLHLHPLSFCPSLK